MAHQLERIKSDQKLLADGQNQLEKIMTAPPSTNPEQTKKGRSCAEVISPSKGSGIYEIRVPRFSDKPFKVACDASTRGGKWTIVLRRLNGNINFYRKWANYKVGFGQLEGEYFLGLDKIHAMTHDQEQELMFILEDKVGEVRYEAYDSFAIGDELDLYKLHTLGKASGTAGDSFGGHRGMYFTTQDRDNDICAVNCAQLYTGAWWYRVCHNR